MRARFAPSFGRRFARGFAPVAGRDGLRAFGPHFGFAEAHRRVAVLRRRPGLRPPRPDGRLGPTCAFATQCAARTPYGAATPLLLGATDAAPPSVRPWAGRGCGRLALPPLRGSPQFCWADWWRHRGGRVSVGPHDALTAGFEPAGPALTGFCIIRSAAIGPSFAVERQDVGKNPQSVGRGNQQLDGTNPLAIMTDDL